MLKVPSNPALAPKSRSLSAPSGRIASGSQVPAFTPPEPRETRPTKGSRRILGLSAPTAIPTAAPQTEPTRRTVSFVYDAGPHPLENLRLNGNWDRESGAPGSEWGPWDIPMRPLGDGRWVAEVELLDNGTLPRVEWGVMGDSPAGQDRWLVMGEKNLHFDLGPQSTEVTYAPTHYHRMGAGQNGEDISFGYWAPNAKRVSAKLQLPEGEKIIPLTRGPEGTWTGTSPGDWHGAMGHPYTFVVEQSDGTLEERVDPYARSFQGEQRGLSRIYIDPKTGAESTYFGEDPQELMRFEVNDGAHYERVELVLTDESGNALSADALRARLGTMDPKLIDALRGSSFNDLWSESVASDGAIPLVRVGDAWTTLVNTPDALAGLNYELRAWERTASGTLVRSSDPINDPWSRTIDATSGKSFRAGIVTPTYERKYDDVPREKNPDKWVIYQLHVGSFLGGEQNIRRSTFEDVINKLDYFVDLGVNTLELLPVGEFEGTRNWGYYGSNVFGIESAYGFEHEGRWVSGVEALQIFIDEAHRRGLNVLNDVVYNHVWGEYDPLQEHDGPSNPYYNWSRDPAQFEERKTPWGPMPAFNNPKVHRYFVDHAVAQVMEYGFDGLRFDFTGPIKDMGEVHGWNFLREINRQLDVLKPEAFTVAEQFDYDPAMTDPIKKDGTGAGFDAQWYTEIQHRLVHEHNHHNPALLQQVVRGERVNVDRFMGTLVSPRGLKRWDQALYVISNHDEVGNAERTVDVADGDADPTSPPQRARNLVRLVAAIGNTAPGIPIFFQGEEFLARNDFKWGITTTWGMDWSWQSIGETWDWNALTFNDSTRALYEDLLETPGWNRDPRFRALSDVDRQVFRALSELEATERSDVMDAIGRRQTHRFMRDAIALRNSTEALAADGSVQRLYTHNHDAVLAYTRKQGDEEFVVIANLNEQTHRGYPIPLPPGDWEVALNSDARAYGGNDEGPKGILSGPMDLPAGGVLILRRRPSEDE